MELDYATELHDQSSEAPRSIMSSSPGVDHHGSGASELGGEVAGGGTGVSMI